MPTAGDVLTFTATGKAPTYQAVGSGVTGPASSTDRAISTWNGTGGTALFNNSTVKIDSTGRYTNSTQPAFFAYDGTGQTDVTGDGTVFTEIFDTELFDIGSNYNNGSGVFTAPVTGYYFFSVCLLYQGFTVPTFTPQVDLVTTGQTYTIGPYGGEFTGNFPILGAWTISLSATNTVKINAIVSSGTKIIDIYGAGGDPRTFFCGYLIG